MKRIKNNTRRHASGQRGMALLTVVALLSFFAVVGTAFVFTMRLEEQTARNFERTTRISEITGIGAEVAEAALRGDFTDPDGLPNTMDDPSCIVSEQGSWYFGYAGWLDHQSFYTARGHLPRINPLTIGLTAFRDMRQVSDLHSGVPNRLYSLGIDEDPPGDLNGDGAPGWAGFDDDGDGFADYEDPDVIASMIRASRDNTYSYNPAWDDDEDGLMDEDGQDNNLPLGEGIDADDDALGVTDESGKLNINLVGNSVLDDYHRHNQGATTFEIDPTMFFIARGIDSAIAARLTRNLVLYRNGVRTVADVGNSNALSPGLNNIDDNGNNNSQILEVVESDDEIESVEGNKIDDDGDYLIDEADEFFIGGGEKFGAPVKWVGEDERFMFGDGIDNNADGEIDEYGEGIDEPAEFNPLALRGDDNAFDTLEELRLVPAAAGGVTFKDVAYTEDTIGDVTYYDLVKAFVTVYSSAPAVSPQLEARGEDIQINLANNYTPWSVLSQPLVAQPGTLPASLLSLQVDNDGDWTEADDFNGNGRPDANWDGTTNENEIEGDEFDNDGDGRVDETDADFNQDGYDTYDPEYHLNEDPLGDANGDGFPGVGAGTNLDTKKLNFTVSGDDDGDGKADFEDDEVEAAMSTTASENRLNDRLDNDWNHFKYLNDRIDNDFDGLVDETMEDEIAAGVDPADATDEGVDEELLAGNMLPANLQSELDRLGYSYTNINALSNHPLEKYFAAFDDDEDGRMDEDPPEFDLLVHLIDDIDQLSLDKRQVDPEETEKFQSDSVTKYDTLRFNPREVRGALTRDMEGKLPDRENDPSFFQPGGPTYPGETASEYGTTEADLGTGPVNQVYEGSEGVFINEVMVRPVVVLQAEHAAVTVDPNSLTDDFPAPLNNESRDSTFAIKNEHIAPVYTGGDCYFVMNDNDKVLVSGVPTRFPQDEVAEFFFGFNNDLQIPAGAYDFYFYQRKDPITSASRITEATVQISANGGAYTSNYIIHWNEEGKPKEIEDPATLDIISRDFPSTINQLVIKVNVPSHISGEFSIDRIEMVGVRLPYIELVNLSSRGVNLQDYSLSLHDEFDTDENTVAVAIKDLTNIDQAGELGTYWISPYNPDSNVDPNNLMLICTNINAMRNAYPDYSTLPSGMPILQMNSSSGYLLGDPNTLKLYNDYIRTPQLEADDDQPRTRIIDLINPSGEVVDSFEISYKVQKDRTSGFMTQQRDDPTRAKYQYNDAAGMEKRADPRRLYLWDADLMLSEEGGSGGESNAIITRMEDFWDDDPRYPGQLAFKYKSEDETKPDIETVWFAFNLSRRFPDLPFTETDEHYYLDVVINSAPWATDDRVGYTGLDPANNIPWYANAQPEINNATTSTMLHSGNYYSTIRVEPPDYSLDNMDNDTYLVVRLDRPLGSEENYRDIRLLSVDLLDHGEFGMQETSPLLAMEGGSPGVPSFALREGYALVHDGRLASPGYISRVATSGPEWVLDASGIAQLADRLWTGYEQITRGLININTAPASVLAALPWLPPRFFGDSISTSLNLDARYDFHALIAHRLVEGRSEFASSGGGYDSPVNEEGVDDDDDGFMDERPYEQISDILRVLKDPLLRDALEQTQVISMEPDFQWDTHEQMAAFARVAGLITTRSNAFTVVSEGRIVEAQDRTEPISIPGLKPDEKINTTVAQDTVIRTIERD